MVRNIVFRSPHQRGSSASGARAPVVAGRRRRCISRVLRCNPMEDNYVVSRFIGARRVRRAVKEMLEEGARSSVAGVFQSRRERTAPWSAG